MSTKKMHAVVLRVADFGESDKIVTFYSLESGKVTGIAKGAKKSRKRFSNRLELFSELDVLYDDRNCSGLVRIVEADLLAPFVSLRENYDRYVAAVLACELVYYWSKDFDVDRNIFHLLLWALQGLDRSMPPRVAHIFYQMKLYAVLGYKPNLSACVKCGVSDASGKPYLFHQARHGLLCRNCGPSSPGRDSVSLSINTIKLLQQVQDLPMDKLERLRFSGPSIREALLLLRSYGHYLLQREIAAWDFMEQESTGSG